MIKIAPHFWRESKATFLKKDMYLITTPWWIRKLYPNCIWDIKTNEKIIYLTFDDGPHPTITPFVLNLLNQYNAKATFFCIGDNVQKFPEIFNQTILQGHSIGNHTMHHINGWKTNDENYLEDINQAQKLIPSNLFRPPYGRATKQQILKLSSTKQPLKTIMWSVLAGDWVTTLSPQKCYNQIKNKIYAGCIVVFHDSEKANQRMSYALPKLLHHFSNLGYTFKSIPTQNL